MSKYYIIRYSILNNKLSTILLCTLRRRRRWLCSRLVSGLKNEAVNPSRDNGKRRRARITRTTTMRGEGRGRRWLAGGWDLDRGGGVDRPVTTRRVHRLYYYRRAAVIKPPDVLNGRNVVIIPFRYLYKIHTHIIYICYTRRFLGATGPRRRRRRHKSTVARWTL